VNLDDVAKGIYFLRLFGEHAVDTYRIIIE